MMVSIIDVSCNFLHMGIKKLLNEIRSETGFSEFLLTQRVKVLKYDIIFIDSDELSPQSLLIALKTIPLGAAIFITATEKFSFYCIDLALQYDATILFKNESLQDLKNKINLKISSKLLRENKKNNNFDISIKLTDCQLQIIDLVCRGFSGTVIAKILNRSEKSISFHKRSAMKKIGVRTNSELFKLQIMLSVMGVSKK